MTQEQILTVSEVSELLRVNQDTVLRYLKDGKLNGFRPGGRRAGWRIPRAEVERFIAERSGRPGEG
jgi:excisionase family DNA binding protein